MRACGVLLIAAAFALAATLLCVAVMTADTWRERLHHHTLERERAHVYAHSPHCRAASRSKLGDFHRCGEAEAILASPPPFWHATVDVAATLPPMVKYFTDGVRQDLHRVVLTCVAIVGVWAWAKRFITPSPPAWKQWQRANAAYHLPMFKPTYAYTPSMAMTGINAVSGPDIREMDDY